MQITRARGRDCSVEGYVPLIVQWNLSKTDTIQPGGNEISSVLYKKVSFIQGFLVYQYILGPRLMSFIQWVSSIQRVSLKRGFTV